MATLQRERIISPKRNQRAILALAEHLEKIAATVNDLDLKDPVIRTKTGAEISEAFELLSKKDQDEGPLAQLLSSFVEGTEVVDVESGKSKDGGWEDIEKLRRQPTYSQAYLSGRSAILLTKVDNYMIRYAESGRKHAKLIIQFQSILTREEVKTYLVSPTGVSGYDYEPQSIWSVREIEDAEGYGIDRQDLSGSSRIPVHAVSKIQGSLDLKTKEVAEKDRDFLTMIATELMMNLNPDLNPCKNTKFITMGDAEMDTTLRLDLEVKDERFIEYPNLKPIDELLPPPAVDKIDELIGLAIEEWSSFDE